MTHCLIKIGIQMDKTEVIEVQAEVIGESRELAVTNKPGTISANFDALEACVDRILETYDGWEPSADNADDVKQCDNEKKYLNSLAKQLDEKRKAVKAEYMKPLNDFEARANSIRDKIKGVSARIEDVKKQADQAEKDAKYAALAEHYEEFAGLLAPVVPYSKIHDAKWLNKRPALSAAKLELEDRVQRIAADWESLKKRDLDFFDAAEAHFFEHLDLGAAMAYNDKLVEDRKRIEELKDAMQPTVPDAQAPEPTRPEAEPHTALAPTAAPKEFVHRWLLHLEFDAPKSTAIALKESLRKLGISGGTIKDTGVVGDE